MSSNQKLYLVKLIISSYPEGNFRWNQLLDNSISLSPLYQLIRNNLHVSITASLNQDFS